MFPCQFNQEKLIYLHCLHASFKITFLWHNQNDIQNFYQGGILRNPAQIWLIQVIRGSISTLVVFFAWRGDVQQPHLTLYNLYSLTKLVKLESEGSPTKIAILQPTRTDPSEYKGQAYVIDGLDQELTATGPRQAWHSQNPDDLLVSPTDAHCVRQIVNFVQVHWC